jgi:hypothetical protein
MSDVNTWFCGLEKGRQNVLVEDKWMLASAAYDAGLKKGSEDKQLEIDQLKEELELLKKS